MPRVFNLPSRAIDYLLHELQTDVCYCFYTNGTREKIDLDELSNRFVLFDTKTATYIPKGQLHPINEYVKYINLGAIPSTPAYVELANKYADITGITPTEKGYVNTLLQALDAASLLKKIVALYPFMGGTLQTKAINLMRPVDEAGAFRIRYNGAIANNAKGVTIAAAQALCSYVNPSLISNTNYLGYGYYHQQVVNNTMLQLSNEDNSAGFANFTNEMNFGGNIWLSIWNASVSAPNPGGVAVRGYNHIQRINAPNNNLQHRTAAAGIRAQATAAINNNNDNGFFLSMIGGNITYDLSCWWITQTLTDAEHTAFYNAILQFLTSLNRQ
jgi:hypothetical protein